MANIEDSVSIDEPFLSNTKKLFWVTRYSLGRTLSKELLIEHEFADDETRHRLVELHMPVTHEKNYHFIMLMMSLFLNPPIGERKSIF